MDNWIKKCKNEFYKNRKYYFNTFDRFNDDELKQMFTIVYNIDNKYNGDLMALEYYLFKYRRMDVSHGLQRK